MWAASKTWESLGNDSFLEPPKQWALTTLKITILHHTSLFAELVQTHSVCENVAQHQQEAKHTLADPMFLFRLQRPGLQRLLVLHGGRHNLREPRRFWALPRPSGSLPKHTHTQGQPMGSEEAGPPG